MPYSALHAEKIVTTARELGLRVAERFPEKGVAKVSAVLVELTGQHTLNAERTARKNWFAQALSVLLVLAALGAGGYGLWYLLAFFGLEMTDIGSLQGLDSVLNIMIVTGAAVWFVLNLETRQRRARMLARLHELRSIAHVIDMHQLRKDPTAYYRHQTEHSPNRDLTPSDLMAYLEYCAEMLAIIGKLAGLYMQNMNDAVVIEAANDIENLAGGFSQKIWLKINVLQPQVEAERGPPASARFQHPSPDGAET